MGRTASLPFCPFGRAALAVDEAFQVLFRNNLKAVSRCDGMFPTIGEKEPFYSP
jgi:hypothetical protein